MVKKYRKRFSAQPEFIGNDIYQLLERLGGHPAKSRLPNLWANWAEIMGEAVSDLICDLGCKGSLLIVGAQNSLQMQTLQFMAGEILERANQYLETNYFSDIRINLANGPRLPENALSEKRVQMLHEQKLPMCAATGAYLPEMNVDSPVARCYARFVKRGEI